MEKNNLILKKEIDDLKRIIQESNDSKDYLTSKIKSESTICSDLRKLNLKLKEERDELMNNKNNLVNEISDLKKSKNDLEKEIANLKDENLEKTKRLVELEKKKKNLTKDNRDLTFQMIIGI